jgi:hypothetical protein
MIPQIEYVWRLTRNLPPKQRQVVNLLFSEIEHSQHEDTRPADPQPQLEFKFSESKSNYYEPKWFSNGKIQ